MAAELVPERIPGAVPVGPDGGDPGAALGAMPNLAAVPPAGGLVAQLEAAHGMLAALEQGVAGLGSQSADGGRQALGLLPRVDALVNRVVALQADLVGIAAENVTPADLGPDRTFTEARARQTRSGRSAVKAVEQRSRVLREVPGLRDELADGGLSLAHLDAVGRALDTAGEGTRRQMVSESPVILAAARELSAPDLRRELDARRVAIESASADRSFAAVRARRFLRWGTRAGGVSLEGLLDPVAAATVRTALDAVTPVPAADDDRSGEQRSADALVLLAQHTLTVGEYKVGSQLRPHLSILIREDTWLLLLRRRRSGLSCETGEAATVSGTTAETVPGTTFEQGAGRAGSDRRAGVGDQATSSVTVAEAPLAQLEDGTLVPFAALEVLLCDAFVQRTVLDPEGVPLDLGRTERTWSKDARRAILVRDRHCQWPGCTLRASWCEIHHIQRWVDGGRTDRDNGVTLCSEHHHRAHDRAVWIRPVRGGFVFTTADGTRIGATTRLHDHLLVPRPSVAPPEPPPGDPGGEPGAQSARFMGGVEGVPPEDASPAPPRSDAPPRSAPTTGTETDAAFEFPDGCPAALW